MGTLVVGFIVAVVIAASVREVVHDKKKGNCTGCACNCEGSGNCEENFRGLS